MDYSKHNRNDHLKDSANFLNYLLSNYQRHLLFVSELLILLIEIHLCLNSRLMIAIECLLEELMEGLRELL
jgi:hypothetical protein